MNKKTENNIGISIIFSVIVIFLFLSIIFILDVTSRMTPTAPPPDPRQEIIFYHRVVNTETDVNEGYFVTKNGELYPFTIPNVAFSSDYLYDIIEKSYKEKNQETVDDAGLHKFIHNAFEYDYPEVKDTGYYAETGSHKFTVFDPSVPEFSEIIHRWDKLWLDSLSNTKEVTIETKTEGKPNVIYYHHTIGGVGGENQGFKIDGNYVVKYVFPSYVKRAAPDLTFRTRATIKQIKEEVGIAAKNFSESDDRDDYSELPTNKLAGFGPKPSFIAA